MAEGKKARKYGNNKVYCKRYELEGKLERNKKRTARREERKRARKHEHMLTRIKRGKPVPSSWLLRFVDEVPL